ncbi:hypothetical protein [Thalassotalea ganghwensis]
MNYAVLNINDFQLSLRFDGEACYQLGSAWVTKDGVTFDEEALHHSRTNPQTCFDHYWQQISLDDIDSANERVNNYADLVYLQFNEMLKSLPAFHQVVVLVNGQYSEKQLSLLLGVIKACHVDVIAVIDKSVLTVASVGNETTNYFIDLGLHQTTLTMVQLGDNAELTEFHVVNQHGFLDLLEELATWLNQQFISEYRFDCFDVAIAEQSLIDQLYALIKDPSLPSCITISDQELSEITYHFSVDDFNAIVSRFFKDSLRQFISPNVPSSAIFYSTAFGCVGKRLSFLDATPITFEHSIDWQSLNAVLEQNSQGISRITALPRFYQVLAQPMPKEEVSHIIFNGDVIKLSSDVIALPLESDQCLSFVDQEPLQSMLTLILQDGCWTIKNNCHAKVYLNNTLIKQTATIKKGDLVTFAENGNWFSLAKLMLSGEVHG